MEQEKPRDGFTARELFLMREAFKSGVSSGQMHPDHPGTLDGWLDETISDAGHYVAQMLSYDADRLYHRDSFSNMPEMTEEQRLYTQIRKMETQHKIDVKPYFDRLLEIENGKMPKIVFTEEQALCFPGSKELKEFVRKTTKMLGVDNEHKK